MSISREIIKHIPFSPTPEQKEAAFRFEKFITSDLPRCLFLIKGYAGTGKTTFIAALTEALQHRGIKTVLLAPTGKSAKVLASYTGKKASTIHRHIYSYKKTPYTFSLQLAHNRFKNTLFIVDEVSLISTRKNAFTDDAFSSRDLLEDLLTYIFGGKNCKAVFVGDDAQLPPVHQSESLALNWRFLRDRFDLNMGYVKMTTVVRQEHESGILYNASLLRKFIENRQTGFQFRIDGFDDVRFVESGEVFEELESAFSVFGNKETVVLTRSNKRANMFNQQIRRGILWMENEIDAGDEIMAVKNNYFWLDEQSPVGFIANGETMEILSVLRTEEKYGLRFADLVVKMSDYPDHPEIDVKVILDTLYENAPSLSSDKMDELHRKIMEELDENNPELSHREKLMKIEQNPYYNALQIKFSYAITTHKSQGGQWDAVFIDQGYITEEQINTDYYRWLYTAVTRAKQKLYFINFSKIFFENLEDF
ncbi:MAG: ATP-dependent endonuclease [Bacteroidetes bacterium]|nr:MAG: ATP-dependent endonuclease [Bacteroidota bacterium]